MYINYVILFWTILDTPLLCHHVIFWYTPRPPDEAIYVQNNHQNVKDNIKSKIEDDRFGSLTSGILLHFYEPPFLILIPSVLWLWIQSKLGPLQYLMVEPSHSPQWWWRNLCKAPYFTCWVGGFRVIEMIICLKQDTSKASLNKLLTLINLLVSPTPAPSHHHFPKWVGRWVVIIRLKAILV